MGCFSFVWLRSSEAERNDRTVVNKVPFGTLEPYGDRARRREGFEPHDLRVIASRPSSSRVVLRVRQAALPKLALWKTPLAKTPCPWRFGFANPTSHARRSHNPKALCQNFNLQIKKTRDTLRCLLFSLVAEMGFEPHDLRVMSPTSCQTAPPRDNKKEMGRGGFEPPKQVAADLQSVPFGHSGTYPFI